MQVSTNTNKYLDECMDNMTNCHYIAQQSALFHLTSEGSCQETFLHASAFAVDCQQLEPDF